jgi:tetratricopeptide (TPR) repeat protein
VEAGLELELELTKAELGRYLITVRSPAGEATGELRLDAASVLAKRSQLQSTVLASAVTSRRALGEIEAPVRQVGELLFRSLFNAGVFGTYKASVALTQQQGLPLRIVLRTQVPELAALPWEMLYDTDAGAYLCQRDPLVRHVAVSAPTRPLEVHPPLRVLGMVAAPRDQQRLDVEGEKHRLSTALAGLGDLVQLRWVSNGTWTDLQGELVSGSWHVVHFIGHGGFDVGRAEGVLALENHDGLSDLVGADRFSQLLTTQVPQPQLVVLNSCAGAQAAVDDLFSSTAAALVRAGVSASVAMQFAVSDPAAKAFAAGFYQAIAHNHSVADAVRIGRIGIRGTSEDTLEWVTPALYLRGNDAPLFTVLHSPGAAGQIGDVPSPLEAARQAGAGALYQQAMSHFRAGRFRDAIALFDSLLSLQPGYRDAEARRDAAATRQQAKDAYDAAREAEDGRDWETAVQGYAEALRLEPDHADALARQRRCEHERVVGDLFDELRQHTSAQDWIAAAAVANELETVDPDVSDRDGLMAQARRELRKASSNETAASDVDVVDDEPVVPAEPSPDIVDGSGSVTTSAGRGSAEGELAPAPSDDVDPTRGRDQTSSRSRRLYILVAAVVIALVVVGIIALRPKNDGSPATTGGGSPSTTTGGSSATTNSGSTGGTAVPAPFKSATLYGFARHLFNASDCFVPDSEQAPLATTLPHTELVKCGQSAAAYTGVFWCAGNSQDFHGNRAAYLQHAVPGTLQPVSGPPAGETKVIDGIQRAFEHDNSDGARVYWDSPRLLCAGELQTKSEDLAATIDYWRTAKPS